ARAGLHLPPAASDLRAFAHGGQPQMARPRSAIWWVKTVAVIIDLHMPAVVNLGEAHLHAVRSGMLADIHQRLHCDSVEDETRLGGRLGGHSILNVEFEADVGPDPVELGAQGGSEAGSIQVDRTQVEHEVPQAT